MVELKCWIEAFFQIEFLLEMESHWRLECTCNLKVTGSKVDLVLQLFSIRFLDTFTMDSAKTIALWIMWRTGSMLNQPILHEEFEFLASSSRVHCHF